MRPPPPGASQPSVPGAPRVRVHLNLAAPAVAESVIKVQTATGRWVTAAYGNAISLANVRPVVDERLQARVRDRKIGKVPHAFLEGDLIAFHGRLRDLAPPACRRSVSGRLSNAALPQRSGRAIGYNPRFAGCFYAQAPSRDQISEEFVSAAAVLVVGWSFTALGGTFRPLPPGKRCTPEAMAGTSEFERRTLRHGEAVTRALLNAAPAKPRPRQPR